MAAKLGELRRQREAEEVKVIPLEELKIEEPLLVRKKSPGKKGKLAVADPANGENANLEGKKKKKSGASKSKDRKPKK